MAAPATTDERIAIGLESLRLTLGDLSEVAGEWTQLNDGERASWSLDWDQLMATYLPLLERSYRSGAMTPDQQVRYGEVLRQLKEALPLIQRLQLYPPPVPLDEADAAGESAGPGCG